MAVSVDGPFKSDLYRYYECGDIGGGEEKLSRESFSRPPSKPPPTLFKECRLYPNPCTSFFLNPQNCKNKELTA